LRRLALISLLAVASGSFATPPKALFTENKGQWPEQVIARMKVPGGVVFVERSALTFVQFAEHPMAHHAHAQAGHSEGRAHAYRMHFADGRAAAWEPRLVQGHYENHFTGSDASRWGTGCRVFGELVLRDVWPGIDLLLSGRDGLKYELLAAEGADAGAIRFRYEGQEALQLLDGALVVALSTGTVTEQAPSSFVLDAPGASASAGRRPIPSRFERNGNEVSFTFPEGRPAQGDLLIDPVFAFGSYSGSTADNFGCTATYDNGGHLYGAGIVFNPGYPLTVGVLQGFFNGGAMDAGISKWSPDGSSLVWSTYLGGSGNESPHSMVVNAQGELFVMGSTGSADFPTTAGAFSTTFHGGGPVSWATVNSGYGFQHGNGTDVYVAHFNASATSLIGSTYVGGSGIDGLNNASILTHNYGDHFRGEIALVAGQPVVATTTRSTDMPVTPNAPQPALGGGQDGFVFRMNPALTAMLWATYLGGSADDNALGVQFDSAGRVYVSGGTTSADLPMAGTPADNSYNGGGDGYLMRYSANGNTLLGSTYVGTTAYDQCYFVQLNNADEAFTVGQTFGNYPVTPGKYANAGSSQFVHKFSTDLGTSQWSTRLGNGSVNQSLSPTAFLVSDCGQIYLAGWAGTTNAFAGNSNSTTNGSPLTGNAFQSTTNGSDFHLMVLEAEATALNYATYFGGSQSAEHVDGGTSRFDKDGTVYHAVCAGCGGHDDFPTTPGAWSATNNSFNCNLGVFKFELAPAQASIGINGPSSICPGATAQFTNSSTGGTSYQWSFGDSTPGSTAQAPSHVFALPGTYTVTMVLSDSNGCLHADSASLTVTVLPLPVAQAQSVPPICPGATATLSASGGTSYSWSPALGLSATNVPNPQASPPQTTSYIVTVSDACGSDTAQVTVTVIVPQVTVSPDASVCTGGSAILEATGGTSYAWAPPEGLSSTTAGTTTATPASTTTYTVTIASLEGCTVQRQVTVTVFGAAPPQALTDTVVCYGTSAQLQAAFADAYAWRPANGITALTSRSPTVSPTSPTLYIVTVTNACGTVEDSAFVDVVRVFALAGPDTLVCPGRPVQLFASGGIAYRWQPPSGLSNDTIAAPVAVAPQSTIYAVVVSDAIGCSDTAFAQVQLRPWPHVQAGPDRTIEYGDVVQLTATGNGTLTWEPQEGLMGPDADAPRVRPEETTTYTVTVTDADGCTNTDRITIVVTGALYLPNTFTPNGDGYNDGFGALGKDIQEFELMVFNRWGELIWTTNQLNGRWDGSFKGVESPIDTYVWRVRATEISGRFHEAVGHVNLVR
jgi:gliding motility-associated-like protein